MRQGRRIYASLMRHACVIMGRLSTVGDNACRRPSNPLGPGDRAAKVHPALHSSLADYRNFFNALTAGEDRGPARALVEDRLRVRGLDGLRVVDALIMPTITSGKPTRPSS
jgi:hypothetical protein